MLKLIFFCDFSMPKSTLCYITIKVPTELKCFDVLNYFYLNAIDNILNKKPLKST